MMRRSPVLAVALGWASLLVLGRLLAAAVEDRGAFEDGREAMRAAEKTLDSALPRFRELAIRRGLDEEAAASAANAVSRARERIRETWELAAAESDEYGAETCGVVMGNLRLRLVQGNLILMAGEDDVPSALVTQWTASLGDDLEARRALWAAYARDGTPPLPRGAAPLDAGSLLDEADALVEIGHERIATGQTLSAVAALLRAHALDAETTCRLSGAAWLYGLPLSAETDDEPRG